MRAKAVGHLHEELAHSEGLFAGVVRCRNARILQEKKQVLFEIEIAFLESNSVSLGRFEGQAFLPGFPGGRQTVRKNGHNTSGLGWGVKSGVCLRV
jgi:hypothetical protein